MPVQQVVLNVPDEIYSKLLTGEYSRDGSVVRDAATGQIIKHLSEVSSGVKKTAKKVAKNNSNIVSDLLSFAGKYKKEMLITAGVVVGFYLVYKGVKYLLGSEERELQKETEKRMERFHKAMTRYMKQAKEGQLTINSITELRRSARSLRLLSEQNDLVLEIAADDLFELIDCIIEHTKHLAVVNSEKLPETKEELSGLNGLEKTLSIQEYLFKKESA